MIIPLQYHRRVNIFSTTRLCLYVYQNRANSGYSALFKVYTIVHRQIYRTKKVTKSKQLLRNKNPERERKGYRIKLAEKQPLFAPPVFWLFMRMIARPRGGILLLPLSARPSEISCYHCHPQFNACQVELCEFSFPLPPPFQTSPRNNLRQGKKQPSQVSPFSLALSLFLPLLLYTCCTTFPSG